MSIHIASLSGLQIPFDSLVVRLWDALAEIIADAVVIQSSLIPFVVVTRCRREPPFGQIIRLRDTAALLVKDSEIERGSSVAMISGFQVPPGCLPIGLYDSATEFIADAKIEHGPFMPLQGSSAVPFCSPGI